MKLSIIIPVHNGEKVLGQCLQAINASTLKPDEVIVVDDASTDSSGQIARTLGAQVLKLLGAPHGPAFARNRGVEIATGDVLIFIDADVAVHRDTLSVMEKYMSEHDEIAALFGSYDDHPPERGLVTLYKNLQHHYVHQHSQREASTFWAGGGAIRREVFVQLGGFDSHGYAHPSIEDIELGVRLKRAGYRIWLCADVQVTHLKRWTLASLLRADIRDRAIPWTRLILSSKQMPSDLNLDAKSRFSAVAAWGILGFLALGFWIPSLWLGSIVCAIVVVALNIDLYRFFAQQGGIAFAIGAFGLHTLYYLYSSLVFGLMLGAHLLRKTIRIQRAPQTNVVVEETNNVR
jgi:glycosyltransferase involved in cell wall biosynthesis